MTARKLGRLAGLVFVLALVAGGVGAASTASGEHADEGSMVATQSEALSIDWD